MPPACPRKPKWEEEEELDEELGDEEDEEEDGDYEDEEGLGPPGTAGLGPAAFFSRKAQPLQTFRSDGPRSQGGQERPGAGPAHPGGATHVAPPLQPPDHGDWTYEEQFKQVGCAPRRGRQGWGCCWGPADLPAIARARPVHAWC